MNLKKNLLIAFYHCVQDLDSKPRDPMIMLCRSLLRRSLDDGNPLLLMLEVLSEFTHVTKDEVNEFIVYNKPKETKKSTKKARIEVNIYICLNFFCQTFNLFNSKM